MNTLDLRTRDAYTNETFKNIKIISVDKNKLALPFGSYSQRIQKYPSDIDLSENFSDCKTMEEVIKKFSKKLKKIIKDIDKLRNVFLTDFKAGEDKRYIIDIGKLNNGVYIPSDNFDSKIKYLKDEKLINKDDYDLINKILYKKIYTQDDYDIIYNVIRKYRVLRWTTEEILKGSKKLPKNKTITLEKALSMKTIVKIDMVTLMGERFIEVNNLILLSYCKDGVNYPINERDNYLIEVPKDIEKLYFSNYYYSPFKMVKRIYSLSIFKNDYSTSNKVTPLLESNISLIYQVKSDLESILLLLEKYNNPSPKNILNVLDNMKMKLSSVMEFSEEELELIYDTLDWINRTNKKQDKIKLIQALQKFLITVINYETINGLNSIGFNPPPSYLMPSKHTYDRNIKRNPDDNPADKISSIAGGFLFKTMANFYRKRFCDGKARQLKDGEYHYGCHNFTGPGTRIDLEDVRNTIPYNDIDACSKQHDIDYENGKNNPEKIREADEKVLKCYDKYPTENGYNVGKLGINGKMALENLFPMLVRSVAPDFSGRGYYAGCNSCNGTCEK